MKASINIRDARSSDEADWRRLWEGYGVFYETGIAPEITSLTWRRILDPDSRVIGRIAEDEGRVVGLLPAASALLILAVGAAITLNALPEVL